MRKTKGRKLISRLLKKVYCANSLVATLLRAIGVIGSVVLAIVFLKDLDWRLNESVLETLAVLYIFCGMGLLPYWLGGKINQAVEEKKRKTMTRNQQLPGEGKTPYRGCFRFAGKVYESKNQLNYFALDQRRAEYLDVYHRNVWVIREGKPRKKKLYKEWIFLKHADGWYCLCYKAADKSMAPIENLQEIPEGVRSKCTFFDAMELAKADFLHCTEGEPGFRVKVRRFVTTKKRIWVPALILCLLLCTDLSYRFGTCGADTRWRLGYDGVMTISGTGAVSQAPYQWHENAILDLSPIYYQSMIREVVIEEGISEIGSDVFSHYRSVETVELPDSLCYIGERAFDHCDQLKTVSIPDSVTWIAEQAFIDCSGLESISLSNNLTVISEGTFYGCESLSEIAIPDGVTAIEEYAFGHCVSLTNLSVPNSVEVIDGSFEGCEKLRNISLGNGLTRLDDRAFRNCISLKEITIPDSCTVIGNDAFAGCENLALVDLGTGVEHIGDEAFAGCALREIVIPDGVTAMGESAFAWCDELKEITLGSGLSRIPKGAFESCTSLKNVTLPDNIVFVDEGAFAECENLFQVILSSETMFIPQSEENPSFPETARISNNEN